MANTTNYYNKLKIKKVPIMKSMTKYNYTHFTHV